MSNIGLYIIQLMVRETKNEGIKKRRKTLVSENGINIAEWFGYDPV
jgi:predicted regulator of amino acid metabolism with ACT domain